MQNLKTMTDAQIWQLIERLFVACLQSDVQSARVAYIAALDERQARMRRHASAGSRHDRRR